MLWNGGVTDHCNHQDPERELDSWSRGRDQKRLTAIQYPSGKTGRSSEGDQRDDRGQAKFANGHGMSQFMNEDRDQSSEHE